MEMSGLGEAGSNLCCDGAMEKGSTVNNDGIRSIGFGMSALGEISLSLHCKERL